MILKIDNSQDPMSLYRKTKQSQWELSLFWFSLWAFMYSAASQAGFYCSGTRIILNSGSTSLPILYTELYATQVKGKSLTAALGFRMCCPPRSWLSFGSGSQNSIRLVSRCRCLYVLCCLKELGLMETVYKGDTSYFNSSEKVQLVLFKNYGDYYWFRLIIILG